MKIIFIFNDFSLHNHIIETFIKMRPNDEISIVKVPLLLKGKSRINSAQRILPKLSKRLILNKLFEWLIVVTISILPKLLRRGAIFRRLRFIAWYHKLDFHKSDDVMSKKSLEFIRSKNPDLVVTLFHQIVNEELIAIPKSGVINIHPGILPEFKGVQPYFWELQKDFGEAGVSIHQIIDSSIDSGPILGMAKYFTWKGMSVQLNYYLTTLCAEQLLVEIVANYSKLDPQIQDQESGAYFSWPNSEDVKSLKDHQIVSLRDLFSILLGKYDSFSPESKVINLRMGNNRN